MVIVLVGFMGAGKSAVGPLLATRLGLPFVDTDAEIERQAGLTIPEIFREHGEPGFRALERDAVTRALEADNAVIALGGGALGDPAARAALEWATVIHLDVPFTVALRRIGEADARPMLAVGDPKALYDERAAVYRDVADHTVDTSSTSPAEVAAAIVELVPGPPAELLGLRRLRVDLPRAAYDVIVGRDLLTRAAQLLVIPDGAEKAAVITHQALRGYADAVATSLNRAGLETSILEIAEGEASKSLSTAAQLYGSLSSASLHRNDLIVGVGGGVVCDIAGYVASTYVRGVAVVHVPTTLLAQVDAAIGGKTAVNLPRGKNLVGTFHQPKAVIADVRALQTLSDADYRSGMAEVIKHGLIGDPGLLELLRTRASELRQRDEETLEEVVARAASVKLGIVSIDERDRGRRAELNYGHTFGHAIEHLRSLRHGEAVALGMMAAAYAAAELSLIDEEVVELHRRSLGAVGLPTAIALDLEELEPFLEQDKKYEDGLRFVLLEGIARPRTGVHIPRDVLERAIKRLAQ